MTEIRPTIRCFPSTTDTLADSNLPFSCVLTPLYEGRSSSAKKADLHLPALSSIPKCFHCGAPHPTRDTHFTPSSHGSMRNSPKTKKSSFLVCYLCGKKTNTDKLSAPAVKSSPKNQKHLPQIFQLPLFSTPSLVVQSLPVMTCPPVCWFLLDGSCPHRSYWTTMSRLLQHIVDDMPSYVHVGIVLAATVPSAANKTVLDKDGDGDDDGIATTTVLSYVDLTSPVPHMLHSYKYHHDDDDDDDDDDEDSSDDESADSDSPRKTKGGLLDHLQLVPADSLHRPNIQAAIRGLVDYDPSQHQLTHQQHSYTMSMPLGRTIETVLDFMDQATHPGAPPEEAQEGSSLWKRQKAMSKPSTTPPSDAVYYAGGKIMSFLASCPTDLRGEDWRPLTRNALPHRSTIGVGGFGGAVRNGSISPPPPAPEVEEEKKEEEPRKKSAKKDDSSSDDNSNKDEEAGFFGSRFKNLPGLGGFATSDDEEEDDEYSDEDEEEGKKSTSKRNKLDQDMTPEGLLEYYRPAQNAEEYYQELGTHCAEAALGVDIFVLVQQQDEADDDGNSAAATTNGAEVDVGLPFLRGLADRSGAPGPLVFGLPHGFVSTDSQNPDLERLERETLARVPWSDHAELDGDDESSQKLRRPIAFGGELRMRLSPSFDVDRSPVDPVEEGPQLAMLYSSNGIMGPATAEEESNNLWRLGTCDPHTALTIDLDMAAKEVKDKLNVEGFGEINWKPVVQSCFAYTTVVPDPDNPGQYWTVRQMRIAHIRVPLTDSVEVMFNSVDPETVAVVLFHKITLTLLRDGLTSAQEIGEDWLRSLLVCAYQSAEDEEEEQREKSEQGYMDDSTKSNGSPSSKKMPFYANERLLDREGDLSAEEVLLAQGHELLKSLPLIVYSLLQCDAIRLSSPESYIPTLDARCAAGAQMSAMTPSVLSKCIAPRLQLWSCQEGLVMDMLDLKADAVRLSLKEFASNPKTGSLRDDLVLFLDSPGSIVICDASRFQSKPSNRKHLSIGPALLQAIDSAMQSYRTPPTLICDLDNIDSAMGKQSYYRLLEVLVEDLPMSKEVPNFKAWGEELASEVHDELDKDD